MHYFSNLFDKVLYMFRTGQLFIIRSIATMYRGADKSLVLPGRKQAAATEDFDVHISYF